MEQFELDFEPGLTDRFPEFLDCVRAAVYGCGRPFKAIAADLDMSPSALSQKLADNADTNFPLRRMPDLLRAANSLEPIYWLVEKFCDDPDVKHRRNVEKLAQLLPEIVRLVGAK